MGPMGRPLTGTKMAPMTRTSRELLESLQEAEEDVEASWAAEIQDRVAAARAGEIEGTDYRTVLARVEKEVLGR